MPYQLYWSIKSLIFDILSGWFSFFDDLMRQLLNTENIYFLYLLGFLFLFYIISILEILCMIFLFLVLYYEYYNIIC